MSNIQIQKTIPIVAALFTRSNQGRLEIALFQRRKNDTAGGLWEFPGGKVETGETNEAALIREIQEELNIKIKVQSYVGANSLVIQNRILNLEVYWVLAENFNWTLMEHDNWSWVDSTSWQNFDIAPLDIPFITMIFDNPAHYIMSK